jgi:hypothetical protein
MKSKASKILTLGVMMLGLTTLFQNCQRAALSGSGETLQSTSEAPPAPNMPASNDPAPNANEEQQAEAFTCVSTTLTVPTDEQGVTCTQTLPTLTTTSSTVQIFRSTVKQPSGGPDCHIYTTPSQYLGTVVGARYGVCQNFCAVRAICTSTGWKADARPFTW